MPCLCSVGVCYKISLFGQTEMSVSVISIFLYHVITCCCYCHSRYHDLRNVFFSFGLKP